MVNAAISGKTDVYGLIGDPVSHSFSPFIHNTIAEKLGDDIAYLTFHVAPDGLENAISGAYALSVKGLNVTIPHKERVMGFLAGTDSTALEAGAVNTIACKHNGYWGYNTDVTGIINTFKLKKIYLRHKKVIVLGAGGGARAAAVAMAKSGVSEINIVNRSADKASLLSKQINTYFETKVNVVKQNEMESIGKHDIMINATSVGFGNQQGLSPVENADYLAKTDILLDIIYTPWETKLIKDAGQKGVWCINGFDMLVYQAVAAYEIWREKRLDDELVIEIMEELKEYYINNNR